MSGESNASPPVKKKKPRKKRDNPEDRLQEQVANWLRSSLPDQAVFHHSPNEVRANKWWIMKRARLGVQAGWPDLQILYRGKSIFIELKAPGLKPSLSKPTKSQEACHERITLAGGVVTTCCSLEEVDSFLSQLMPLKSRISA